MKRALFIVAPLLIALASLVSVTAAALAFPAAAQNKLAEYLHNVCSSSSARAEGVQAVVRASRPWNLNQDPDYPVFGASWYYQIDRRYDWKPVALETPAWQLPVVQEGDAHMAMNHRSRLPFPPRVVWCVLLDDGQYNQVIFLAHHHREPYHTDWVVHQGPQDPFSQSFLDTLTAIGCNLIP